jgi:tetratricopeptide (TPR) repeat protein
MMSPHLVLLTAAMVALGQDAEMPDVWKHKIEAAATAEKADHPVQAEALLAEVVSEAEKFGRDDLRVAQPLEFLAGFYLDRKHKHYAQAEPLLRRALAIRLKAQGPEHPDVAMTHSYLAMCLIVSDGKNAEIAGPMLKRALSTLEKFKGKDDPAVASVLHDLYAWHMGRKDYDEAEKALTRAVSIREKELGPESLKVAELLDDLGDLHSFQVVGIDMDAILAEIDGAPRRESRFEKHGKQAESFYKRSLAIREKALKPDDPDIAEALYKLGQLAVLRAQPKDVEPYFNRWLAMHEKANAPVSEKEGTVLCMLGMALSERQEFDQAERRLTRAQTVFEEISGAASDHVTVIRTGRASVAIKAGRFDDAERLLKLALAAQAKVIGADDPDVKQAGLLMAGGYQDHVANRRGHERWHRLEMLAKQASKESKHDALQGILQGYADLLRRTNRAVPRPTEEDLAFLKKAGAVFSTVSLDDLATEGLLIEPMLDDQALSHIARLYSIERLNLNRRITDVGLAHIKDLTNLRELDVTGAQITDAGLAHLVDLKELENLNLGFTRVGDGGLPHLKWLKKLRELNLMHTEITDAGLEHLRDLEGLRKLNLKSTKVTQTGVDRLRRETPAMLVEYESGHGFVAPNSLFTPTQPPDLPAVPGPSIPQKP